MTKPRSLRTLALMVLLAAAIGWSCGGTTDDRPPDDGLGGADASSGGTPSAGSGGGHPGTGATSTGTGGTDGALGTTDCHFDSDCTVAGWSSGGLALCDPCDPVSASQLKAVSQAWLQAQPRPLVDCGPCAEVTEAERTGQYFFPRCEAGACTLKDLRQDPATECTTGEDCWLRDGADCCSGCDGEGYVAINSTDFLGSCSEQACPRCASAVPEGLAARCNPSSGRCEVALE
jgi:hypothetical protein